MQALDFDAALAELLHHLIEVAAKVSDFVVAVSETYGDAEISTAELSDFLLQFDHGTLHGVREDNEQSPADRDCACTCDEQDEVTFGIAPGECCQQEEQHSAQQNKGDWNQRFDLPVNAEPWQLRIVDLGLGRGGVVRHG